MFVADVGDEREVVVDPPLLGADRRPPAAAAVADALGVGRRRGIRQRGLETVAELQVLRPEVGNCAAVARAVAREHVEAFGQPSLDLREKIGAPAELHDGGPANGPCQARVRGLVGPRAEVARSIDAFEEVGVGHAAAHQQRRLEDHLGAGVHGLRGLARRGRNAVARTRVCIDRGNLDASALLLEHRVFVLAAQAVQHVEEGIVVLGPFALSPSRGEIELGQVLACGEPRQVGGAGDQLPVDDLHGSSMARSRGAVRAMGPRAPGVKPLTSSRARREPRSGRRRRGGG